MKGYIPTLDGWRAVAILGVLLCHGAAEFFGEGGLFPNWRLLAIAYRGSHGVDLFFGLSGFLITARLLEERRRCGRIDLRRFYARRAFRILPASLTFLAVLAALTLAFPMGVEPWEWRSCLLFARNYVPGSVHQGWYTGHFWSLSAEEHFYLLWPALLCAWAVAPKRAAKRTATLLLSVAAWAEIEPHVHLLDRILPGVFPPERTDLRLDGMLWGCWLALVLADPSRREALRSRLGRPGVRIALVIGFLATSLEIIPVSGRLGAALIPTLLAATVLHPHSRAGRLLDWAPLRWLGRLSFSIYLWQQLFLLPARARGYAPLGRWQEWPLNVPALFACATLSYALIERPMVRLGQRLVGVKLPEVGVIAPGRHLRADAAPGPADVSPVRVPNAAMLANERPLA